MTEDRDRDARADAPDPHAPRVSSPTPSPLPGGLPPRAYAFAFLGVFAIVFGLFIVFRRPPSNPGVTYDDRTRIQFLDACVAGGGASSGPVCECAYGEIVAKVPYDRFRSLDSEALGRRSAGSAPVPPVASTIVGTTSTTASPLPDDVRSIFATCVGKQLILAAPSTSTTSSTTSTTSTLTSQPAAPAPSLTLS